MPFEIDRKSHAASSPATADAGSAGPFAASPLSNAMLQRKLQRRIARKKSESAGENEAAPPGETFKAATTGGGSDIPFRGQMEKAFGEDFSGVRAHLGQAGPMKDLSAKAATQGQTIAFATTSPDPRLVAHELAHVVQNRRSGDRPVSAASGLSHPNDASEKEADAMADQVAAGGRVKGAGEAGARMASEKGACCDDCACDGTVQRSADAGDGRVPPAQVAKRHDAVERVTSIVTESLPHVRRISSPQAAADKERHLMERVAVLRQHRDDPSLPHGDAATEAKQEQHFSELHSKRDQLVGTAGKGTGEPAVKDEASAAKTPAGAHRTEAPEKVSAEGPGAKAAAPAGGKEEGQTTQREVIQRSPECDDLIEQIKQFINELKQRFNELLRDDQHLQWDNWSTSNPKPGVGSVEGHQIQFREKQNGLRNRINKWLTDNCNGGGGTPLPVEAWEWAYRTAPNPIYQPRPAPPAPEPSSNRGVWAAIAIGCAIGIGLLLAPEVTIPAVLAF